MSTQLAVLADGHIGHDDPERLLALVRALDGLPPSVKELWILGDLFEVWIGVARPEPQVEALGAALGRLRARGVRTGYVEGNRDYHIADGPPRRLFDMASREAVDVRFGTKTLHLAHGDLLNLADRQYRAWRFASRRLLAPLALRLLPAATLLRLGGWLERRFRTTNRRHKGYFPGAACEAYTRAAMSRGADLVVVGHLHQALGLEVTEGGRKGLFVSLPFWHQEPRFVYIDEEGRVTGLEP